MRHLFVMIMAVMCLTAKADDARMSQALAQCQDGNYSEAIETYESVLASGQTSATLYYNLGYAYYKSGMLGKAVLNFERAKRLSPNDADIAENLEQVYSLTDQMQTIEPVFFVKWWRSLCNVMSSDGWAWLFVILFVLVLVGVGLFLFADAIALRKVGFYSAIVLFVIGVASLAISIEKRSEIIDGNEAIIMASSTTLTTSPDKNGSEMAVLHEGTHVDILSQLGEWIEVQLKDGNVGWLKKSDVEVI
ncbi:MAG: tetratricopeptide repeat protein [Bacteroidales bacterium]|nr:tetratricopeptide repeat protein [Bacteroidales bacterium]